MSGEDLDHEAVLTKYGITDDIVRAALDRSTQKYGVPRHLTHQPTIERIVRLMRGEDEEQ